MDLQTEANQLLAMWLFRTVEAEPTKPHKFPEVWSVPARELYDRYVKWSMSTPFRVITPQAFVDVIKALYPRSEVANFGVQSEKRFTGMRWAYDVV